jgi:CheY-like chemotaxis protein
MVKSLRPDLIILDLVMPGFDGWAVLAALKNDAEVHDIPVVIVSILDDPSRGVVLGANDYVTKPVKWERLVDLLRKYRAEAGGEILVVDDDPAWREVCRRTLEQHGWNVCEAEDGRTALGLLAQHRPGVILLDLMMPVMNGFEVLDQVRRHSEWNDMPVIFVMTAKDLNKEERQRLNGAVQGILAKGRRGPEELLDEVVREVKRYRRRHQPADKP